MRVRKALGSLELVNARDGGPLTEAVKARGFDLNQGMVLVQGEEFYFGAESIHRLALMSTRSGCFNTLNALIFARPGLAQRLYPLLRFGRFITLKLLGRSQLS